MITTAGIFDSRPDAARVARERGRVPGGIGLCPDLGPNFGTSANLLQRAHIPGLTPGITRPVTTASSVRLCE